MASATIFKGFNNPIENKSLIILAKEIQGEKYKEQVEKIRYLLKQGNKEEGDKLKKALPAFTPSATFKGGRKLEFITNYSGFVVLDLDKLQEEQLEAAFSKAIALPYTFSCFRSPSGNGLKILVEVTSDKEQHEQAYKQVAEYYEKQIGLQIDRSGKDITRLCFVSYDPDTYRNIRNEKFPVVFKGMSQDVKPTLENATKEKVSEKHSNQYELLFQMQISFTNQKCRYEPNNRNNYIYLLASNCNRAGIPEHDTLFLCSNKFDLDNNEVTASVKSAYQHHAAEFAKFANTAKLQGEGDKDPEDFLKNTPSIPCELYEKMPEILKKGALAFLDARERDVFLTGALGILSGCLPKVKGLYAQQVVYPNLFTFAIAPAASGKGALKFAKQLGDEYHMELLNASRQAEEQYQIEDNAFKQKARACRKGEPLNEEPPKKPPFKVVFIPANTSYAKILWHMEQNKGTGIICETEADTLGNIFKQEWGSYSDMLRKSFHHERLSSSRKTNNEFTEVNEPALSIALSGTPNQVTGLIASAEDGLFSRFLFYAFKVDQDWKDVSPYASNINLTDHFNELSKDVHNMVKFLQISDTDVLLSRNQWEFLNNNCRQWLLDITTFTSEDAASIVKRLGLIMYRIAMLFTAMRKFKNGDMSAQLECTDNDFSVAFQLTAIYLHHSILMFNNLPKQENATVFQTGDNKRKFFEALPADFTRQEAVNLGPTFSMKERTVDLFLKTALGNLLKKLSNGRYQKL